MKNIFYIMLLLLASINSLFAVNELTIDVDNKEFKKINIVFEKIAFIPDNRADDTLILNLMNVVKNNLNTTNLFLIQKASSNLFKSYDEVQSMTSTDLTNFVISKYAKTTVDSILSGYITIVNEGKLQLQLRLWDVLDQRELLAKSYIINENNWKRVADIISDNIYELLTGEIIGHFDSKIIFIAESGKVRERKRRLAIVDFDGSNIKYITNGENIVLTPIFSKFNKDEIIYLEYEKNKKPHLFKTNLLKNETLMIGNTGEMTFAPNFNPNGTNEVVFSATKDGISNIFKLNFDAKALKQLTFDKSISTVPSWSPDGNRIVFVSDKTGVRKLYIMDKNGENAEKITNNRGVYDKPSWSPDGKLISFVKLEAGEFAIGLMTPNGENERTIMSAYLVEGIKWSPNGRYLIYSKQEGPFGKASIPGIYTIDILTGIEYRIPTPENQGASDPDWIRK